ncbi:MAG: hypothetical protein OXH09_19395 [Gammaproteobacteria bacterium]|nr:hypothetical protein [Gammaproteobacteria bacterium]
MADILRVLDCGWRSAVNTDGLHPEMDEVALTGRLRAGMIAAINDKLVRSSKKISILPGTESWPEGAKKPAGLTDISVHLREIRERLQDHGPHAIIECKRVAGNAAALCRLYVLEGIDRFKETKYAERHAAGFMAGYLLSGDALSATAGINRYLSGQGRQSDHLNTCTVFDADWARSSRHSRPRSTPSIELHHAFLTFLGISS